MKAIVPQLKRILLQVLLLLGIYFISRCLFAIINRAQFAGLGPGAFVRIAIGAIRYDLSAILTLNLLYFLLFLLAIPVWRMPRWERLTQWLFAGINAIALMFEVSDWAYYPFNQKRATLEVFNMLSRQGDFWLQLPHFLLDYWFAPVGFVALVWLLVKTNNAIRRRTPLLSPDISMTWVIGMWQAVALIFVAGLSVLGIRGGWQVYPIGNQNAIKVAGNAYLPIVLNTPFSIMHSYSDARLEALHYTSDAEAETFVRPIKQYGSPADSFRPMNVVYIILESFSKEYTGWGGRSSYTPFLDSLAQHGFVCTNAFANSLHSAEGVPAIISGVPTLMSEPITTSVYGTNRLTSMPSVLKLQGYQTAFYHGGTNGTMAFDIYAANAGFDRFYGRTEYGNEKDYDGAWGIWDEPFLQYFAAGLTRMQQPFAATMFTLTSHDPYAIPAQYKSKLPTGNQPLMQTIAYTDMALRKFFKTASAQPWYNNTLFVLTADHAAPNTPDSFYNGHHMGHYAVPLVLFAPGDTTLRGSTHRLVQQIDILPTVLDYLHYREPFFALGNSIFDDVANRFVVTELGGWYQWYMDDYLLSMADKEPEALFYFKQDSMCHNNLLGQQPEKAKKMLGHFHAFLQYYHWAMIHNRMWVER
jgi:phosphoglycerol transferase MdoB-like AlkP superfamily enzyme